MIQSKLSLLALGLFVRLCASQASGWIEGEVNTTMCYWTTPRTGVVRDTLYIDGGYLWWEPGLANGSFGGLIADGNPLGLVYLLNFSTPFNTSQNISAVFTTISKAANAGAANNVGPNYYDGTMFANDFEWFTYGGMLGLTDAFNPPAADSVAAYEVYASGPPKTFEPGYILDQLPDDITRYVTDGAGVSIPSENLGFYFGGLRSASWGPIYYLPANESLNPDQQSLTLIQLNMTVQQQETWINFTLPTEVPGRASAEIVWVPVSEHGILVALGGVIYPAYDNITQKNNASANAASMEQSPKFMSTVSVYDIANQVWYDQNTTGAPGALAQGCTVVASAQDGSSHNIYWYGGFDGLHLTDAFSDDVWILSVPSFQWVKVYSGTASHARAGHRCTKPYPDQMFVIGGYSSLSGGQPSCLDGGIIQIFNLSSAAWIDSYDPTKWSNYTVPSAVYQIIGGTATGSATESSPSPSGFANATMTALFDTSYNASKITNWYPYTPAQTGSNNRTTLLPIPVVHNGTPKFLAPVLGVVLGLIFILLLITAILLWRRRKWLSSHAGTQSEAGTLDNRFWVSNWLRGTPADAKAPTVTTDETISSPYEEENRPFMPEVGGTQVHEMMDTSRPVELHDTGFIPMDKGINGHHNGLAASPSVTSHTSHASRTSTVSRVSHTSSPRPGISPLNSPRADSPFLGETGQTRVASDTSEVSEAERGHLRGISNTSASSYGAYGTSMEIAGSAPVTGLRPAAVSPLTPPHEVPESRDYIGAGLASSSAASPSPSQRRSNFAEGLDEMK